MIMGPEYSSSIHLRIKKTAPSEALVLHVNNPGGVVFLLYHNHKSHPRLFGESGFSTEIRKNYKRTGF